MNVLFVCIGFFAFILFFLYDWCTVKRPDSLYTKCGFYIAAMLVFAAVFFAVYPLFPFFSSPARLITAIIFFASGLGGLVKVLFFSLPKGTYSNPSKKRKVYAGGFYAVCRHPGFWPYLLLFIGLLILFGRGFLPAAMLLCSLNFVYIVFQDRWTFRLIFEDYDEYSKQVPFLIPSVKSLTPWIGGSGKEK